jgi:signal transduction histidine kinase
MGRSESQILGRSFFEFFSDPSAVDLAARLTESFTHVVETRSSHPLWTDLYPRAHSQDTLAGREFCKLLNIPVLNARGAVAWLIHMVQMRLPAADFQSHGSEPEGRAEPMPPVGRRFPSPSLELLHHSRYDMVGLATSTIAHELNRSLTAATNYMRASRRLMGAEASQPDRVGELLDKALFEMKSVGEGVRVLRGMAGKRDAIRELEDVNSLIGDAISACVEHSRDRGITIDAKLETQMPLVPMDRVHVGQVLLNLVRNALDAAKESPEKRVGISTDVLDGFVQVTVDDSGPGIPEAVKAKLFQPFAGTKEHGIGLGLAICKAIVEAHGGDIWFESPERGGARFGFRLPTEGKRNL